MNETIRDIFRSTFKLMSRAQWARYQQSLPLMARRSYEDRCKLKGDKA